MDFHGKALNSRRHVLFILFSMEFLVVFASKTSIPLFFYSSHYSCFTKDSEYSFILINLVLTADRQTNGLYE